MPEVIGLAILSSVGAGAAATTTVLGVSVATLVGSTALIGGSLALNALTTPDQKQKVASQQYSSRQALPPRRRAYGRVKLAGPYIAYDADKGSFYTAMYLCEGPIAAIEEIWLDDKISNVGGAVLQGIAGIEPWVDHVCLQAFLGEFDQGPSGILRKLPYWSDAHRLRGCAYVVMQAVAPEEKKFRKRFPSGSWPQTRAIARASRVRDPSIPAHTADPATWEWSDICTPCIRDLLTHQTWGMKIPDALIDDASFAAHASLCKEIVLDKNGVQFPRYYLGGSYDLTEEPASVLQQMLAACDSRLYLTQEGNIGITGGRFIAPDVTIGHDAIFSIGSLEIGTGKRASFNRLKISYLSPAHDYQMVEGDPWEDEAAQAAAGETLEADFSRPWVQNHNQVRRLAKIHTARENPRYRITGLVTNRRGLPGLYEDAIQLDLPRYGISGPFEVKRAVAQADGATCTFDLVSVEAAAWAFNAAIEEGDAPPLADSDALPDEDVGLPVNLTVIVERRVVNGTITAVFLRLLANEPARADLVLLGRYRRVGDVAWIDMAPEGDNRGSVISSVVADGETYEVQGAIGTLSRSIDEVWVDAAGSPVTAVADATPPGQPTAARAVTSADPNAVDLAFTAPPQANFRRVEVRRAAAGQAYAQAVVVGSVNGSPNQELFFTDRGLTSGTVYRYWLIARNGSGAGSDPLGPLEATAS